MVNGIAVLLKYKMNKICCLDIKIRQLTKIICNFVIYFIYLFKNNGKIIFIIIICSNCIITPKWDVIMNPFFSLTVFLYRHYYIIFTGTYQYICLNNTPENEKFMFYDRARKLFLFGSKFKYLSWDQMKYYLIQFEIILLKLNQVKFKLRCVESNFKQIKYITMKSN